MFIRTLAATFCNTSPPTPGRDVGMRGSSVYAENMNQRRILVKCGGFATQLQRHVNDAIDGDPLWSARYDAKNPDAVIRTHLDFLENGAQIILSNTYQASVDGFVKHLNLSREESIELIKKSVRLAKQAKEMFLKSKAGTSDAGDGLPLVMASIGPYGAHLSDASEYRGCYADTVTSEMLRDWHRVRIEACLSEGVDGLAIETIPCQLEAEAVVDLICDEFPNAKFWVSFQCKDEEHLAHGQRFDEAALSIWNKLKEKSVTSQCIGIGVNCVHPKLVAPLFKSTQGHNIPLIVYSNRGEIFDDKDGWTGTDKCIPLPTYIPEWVDLGATVIGGCCRVYASDIFHIRQFIDGIVKQPTSS